MLLHQWTFLKLGFSRESLDNLSGNRLAKMAEEESKAGKRGSNKLRSKQGRGIGFDIKTPLLVVAVLAVGGFLGIQQGWFAGAQKMVTDMVAGFGSGGDSKTSEQDERDAKVLAEATELASSYHLTKAKQLIEKHNEAYGLTPQLEDKLDEIYIQIAKYNAKKGKKTTAIKELKKIPESSSHYDEAKELIKKYSKKTKKRRRSKRRRGRRR